MKILDCFPYFNEKELMEFRIRLLSPVVDHFVICDANRTHNGDPKPFSARKTLEELGLFNEKVTVIEITLPSREEVPDNWIRENLQRDALTRMVTDYETVCIVTDTDEIMDPSFVKYYANVAYQNKKGILRIPMAYLNAKADLQLIADNGSDALWASGFMGMKHHFDCYSPSKIRESHAWRRNNVKFADMFQLDGGINLMAGWHFAWMGGREKMLEKWQAFADQNDKLPTAAGAGNKQEVEKFISAYDPQQGSTDPIGRTNHRLRRYPIHSLPRQVFEHKRIKNYLFPPEFKREHFHENDAIFGENWFTYPNLYREMVNRFPSGSKFVEVGVWKGRSIAYLTTEVYNSKKNIECYCVDTWEGSSEHKTNGSWAVSDKELAGLYDIFENNLLPLKEYCIPMKMESLKAAERFNDESVDFVFIDAAHEYELVKADILKWYPKVKKGGVFAGHDCYPNNPEFGGVYKAVTEIFGTGFRVNENCFIVDKL